MHEATSHGVHHHAPPTSFIRKYIFSVDHKVIGKQYFGLGLVAVLVGTVLSWLMRIHLAWGSWPIPGLHLLSQNGAPGNIMTPEYYLQLMTMHATIMVFFVLTVAPFAAFGNFFLPIQVGAEDMPFPHINMMSFWVTLVGFLVLIAAFFVGSGPPLSGWTAYAPLSALGEVAGPGQGTGQVLWAASIAIFCVGQLLGSLNFIPTTLDMRTKGMTLSRMPFTVWAWFITSLMGLAAFAVLMPACILLILDHVAGTSFFIPGGLVVNDQVQPHSGGSTLLWQHLFWFFGHPEVYIAIVPAMGIVSHVLVTSMRRALLSYKVIIGCMLADRCTQLHGLWTSHVRERNESVLVAGVLVPHAYYHDSGNDHRAHLDWGACTARICGLTHASLFALGFISMFVSGGVSGFFLAQP